MPFTGVTCEGLWRLNPGVNGFVETRSATPRARILLLINSRARRSRSSEVNCGGLGVGWLATPISAAARGRLRGG